MLNLPRSFHKGRKAFSRRLSFSIGEWKVSEQRFSCLSLSTQAHGRAGGDNSVASGHCSKCMIRGGAVG